MQPLSVDDLWRRVENMRTVYAARNALLDSLEPYYFIDHPTAKKQEREKIELIRLPDAPNAIDLVQDLFAYAGFSLNVPAGSEKPTDREAAITSEKYLQTVLKQSERSQRMSLLGESGWTAAMRGCVAARVRVVMDWMDEEQDLETGDVGWAASNRIPILVQLRDPRYIMPMLGVDGLQYVVEFQTRTVEDVQQSYGPEVLANKNLDDTVEWAEYWDRHVYCYWADGTPVTRGVVNSEPPWPHMYGCIPYSFEFCRTTAKREPERRIRPILEAQRGVLEKQDMLASQSLTFIAEYLGTSWKLFSTDIDPNDIDLQTGSIIPLDPLKQEDLVPLQGGREPLEIKEMQSFLGSKWEQGTFPQTLYGQDIGGDAAGYMVNLLNQSGQARINSMTEAIERMMSDVCETVLEVSANVVQDLLGGPIPFHWTVEYEGDGGESFKARDEMQLDAEMLRGVYDVEFSLGETMPADDQANAAMANQYRQPGVTGKPLLSDTTILENLGLVKSPTDELMRIEREIAMASPEIQELLRQVLVASVREELLEKLRKLDIDVDEVMAQVKSELEPAQAPAMQLPPELLAALQGGAPMAPQGMPVGPDGMPIDPAMMGADPAMMGAGGPMPDPAMMEQGMMGPVGPDGMPMEEPVPGAELGVVPPLPEEGML